MQKLRRTCCVRIDVTGDVKAVLAGAAHQLERMRDAFLPVAHAHGLQVADVQGRVQGACDGEHFFDGIADHVALLAHVDGDGNAGMVERREGADKLLRRVKALRRIAKAEGNRKCAVT